MPHRALPELSPSELLEVEARLNANILDPEHLRCVLCGQDLEPGAPGSVVYTLNSPMRKNWTLCSRCVWRCIPPDDPNGLRWITLD